MIKLLSAFLSAVSITLLGASYNFNEKLAKQDVIYSFGYQFFGGLFLILAIYIFLFMPLSFFVDSIITRKMPRKNLERNAATVIGYSLAPMLLVFLVLIPTQNIRSVSAMMLLFGAGGLVFSFFYILISFTFIKLRNTKTNE